MSAQIVNGYMFIEFTFDWEDDLKEKWLPRWYAYRADESTRRVFIREMPITFDVPEDWDPLPRQIAVLEDDRRQAMDEFQRKVADINEQKSKLQALTFDPRVDPSA